MARPPPQAGDLDVTGTSLTIPVWYVLAYHLLEASGGSSILLIRQIFRSAGEASTEHLGILTNEYPPRTSFPARLPDRAKT